MKKENLKYAGNNKRHLRRRQVKGTLYVAFYFGTYSTSAIPERLLDNLHLRVVLLVVTWKGLLSVSVALFCAISSLAWRRETELPLGWRSHASRKISPSKTSVNFSDILLFSFIMLTFWPLGMCDDCPWEKCDGS